MRPKNFSEGDYAFLSVSSRPICRSIVEVLEEWYAGYPDGPKKAAIKREMETSDEDFNPVFFEMLLFKFFTSLGCTVTPEPDPGNNVQSRPDFLVETAAGGQFYCEAVHSTGKSQAQRAQEKVQNFLFDKINEKFYSAQFFWNVSKIITAPQAPSASNIIGQLRNAEKALDWEAMAKNGINSFPNVIVESNGWKIEFHVTPKKKEAWGKPGSKPIGYRMTEAAFSQTKMQIRDEIKSKRRQHVGLDRPLIVAVNAGQLDSDFEDKFDALYGTQKWVLAEDLSGIEGVVRDRDGIWLGNQGVKNSHMPFVLMAHHITPWGFPIQMLEQFPNPFVPIDNVVDLPRIPRWVNNNGQADYVKGESLGEILGVNFRG
jgi:hypothetical protein